MGFFDNVKDLGNKTVEEGKKYAEITKLQSALGKYENQLKECKTKIGDLAFQRGLLDGTDLPELQELLSEAREIMERMAETRAAVNDLKNIRICPNCKAEVSKTEAFCGKCGTKLTLDAASGQTTETADAKKTCPDCGRENSPEAAFCVNCGKAL